MSGLFFRFKQIVSYLFSFKPLVFMSAICLSTMGLAQEIKSGEQVFKEVCFACHATGAQNAPKFGDKAAWSSLLKEGQQVVTAHGWVGQGGSHPEEENLISLLKSLRAQWSIWRVHREETGKIPMLRC